MKGPNYLIPLTLAGFLHYEYLQKMANREERTTELFISMIKNWCQKTDTKIVDMNLLCNSVFPDYDISRVGLADWFEIPTKNRTWKDIKPMIHKVLAQVLSVATGVYPLEEGKLWRIHHEGWTRSPLSTWKQTIKQAKHFEAIQSIPYDGSHIQAKPLVEPQGMKQSNKDIRTMTEYARKLTDHKDWRIGMELVIDMEQNPVQHICNYARGRRNLFKQHIREAMTADLAATIDATSTSSAEMKRNGQRYLAAEADNIYDKSRREGHQLTPPYNRQQPEPESLAELLERL